MFEAAGATGNGRVLVVDDSTTMREWLVGTLSPVASVTACASLEEALKALRAEPFDVVVTDFDLGDGTARTLIDEAGKLPTHLVKILLTAHKDLDEVAHARAGGEVIVLHKPVEAPSLVAWVTNAVTMARLLNRLRDTEAQLVHSQKLEAVGRLAGGIAHDFNNFLTAILGYSDVLLDQLDPADPRRRGAAQIKKAGERAAALTRQLLVFSRRQVMAPTLVDLNAIVDSLHPMLRRLLSAEVELVTRSAPGIGLVKTDRSQIEQVVLNLVVNARDAMPKGGTLTIETAAGNACSQLSGLPPGDYVTVSVADTGCGMSETVRARIFEPFFTTKAAGVGTGLGLSTVYGIVKQSGGYVAVTSEVGRGSTFWIVFPCAREGELAAMTPAPHDEVHVPAGSHTILLAEDEELLRALGEQALVQRGYRVLSAADGSEAHALYLANRDTIDLIVTDVLMPKLNGPQFVERVRQDRPDLRVIFMSGYAESLPVVALLENEAARHCFIEKPFTPSALARKVGEVLARPARS